MSGGVPVVVFWNWMAAGGRQAVALVMVKPGTGFSMILMKLARVTVFVHPFELVILSETLKLPEEV